MSTALHADISTLKAGPTVEIVQVSPALAETWLHQNTSNRSVRRATVKAYARDMQNGNWKITAEPVKFDINGLLIDGQHRLLAVREADVTVPLFVATGLPCESQDAMDSGMKRTAADALSLRGDSNSAMVAAAARLALSVAYAPESIGRYAATHAEVIGWVDDHPAIMECASFASGISSRVKGCPPSVIAYTIFALAEINTTQAYGFWAAVADQVGEYQGDPVVALARKFSEIYREREQIPKSAYLSMIYRAWNSRRGNKQLRAVRVNSPGAAGGLIPVPVPR